MNSRRAAASPRFTVIATIRPNHKGRRALASIRRQVFQDYETVALVEGPLEFARDLAEEFGCRTLGVDHDLSAARSLALEQATGKLVAFIGPSDVWHPLYLTYQARLHDAFPQLLFGLTNYYRSGRSSSGPVSQGALNPEMPNALLQMVCRPFVHNLSTVAAPLASLRAIGGFNRLTTDFAETDLLIRLLAGPEGRKRLACLDHPAINLPQIGLLTEEEPEDFGSDPSDEVAKRAAFLDLVFAYSFMRPFDQFRTACERAH
jgi:hypothetical protein